MSKRICGRCKSTNIEENGLKGEVVWCNCKDCKYFSVVRDFPMQTLFDRITSSPEVLAEKLVYWEHDDFDGWWESNILDGKFDTREEAIAATVAKLKEAEK